MQECPLRRNRTRMLLTNFCNLVYELYDVHAYSSLCLKRRLWVHLFLYGIATHDWHRCSHIHSACGIAAFIQFLRGTIYNSIYNSIYNLPVFPLSFLYIFSPLPCPLIIIFFTCHEVCTVTLRRHQSSTGMCAAMPQDDITHNEIEGEGCMTLKKVMSMWFMNVWDSA